MEGRRAQDSNCTLCFCWQEPLKVIGGAPVPVNYRQLSRHIRSWPSAWLLDMGKSPHSGKTSLLGLPPGIQCITHFIFFRGPRFTGLGLVTPHYKQDWGTTCVIWEGGGCHLSLLCKWSYCALISLSHMTEAGKFWGRDLGLGRGT